MNEILLLKCSFPNRFPEGKKSKKKFARHKVRSDSPDKDVFQYDLEDPGETQVRRECCWALASDQSWHSCEPKMTEINLSVS